MSFNCSVSISKDSVIQQTSFETEKWTKSTLSPAVPEEISIKILIQISRQFCFNLSYGTLKSILLKEFSSRKYLISIS